MKNLTKNITRNSLIIFLSGLIAFSGCDTALDIEADNNLSGDALTSDANIQSALLGAYVNLMGIYDGGDGGELLGGDLQLMATLLTRANNTEISWSDIEAPDYEDFIDKDVLDINNRVEANWRRAYETINTVNAILENLANISNTGDRSRIEGEALAIRGVSLPAPAGLSSSRSVRRPVGRSVGRPVGRSVGWSVGRSAGRSVGRSASRSVRRPVGR